MTTKTEAARRRHELANRDALISALGWAPETHRYPHPESYAATSGEMWRFLVEDKGREFADSVRLPFVG